MTLGCRDMEADTENLGKAKNRVYEKCNENYCYYYPQSFISHFMVI